MNKFFRKLFGYVNRFLLQVYYYWFFEAFALAAFNVFVLGATGWTFALPVLLWAIAVVCSVYGNFPFIRTCLWPLTYRVYVLKLKKMSPLLGYPMLIWLSLSARKIFVDSGYYGLQKALMEHAETTVDGLSKLAKSFGHSRSTDEVPADEDAGGIYIS